MKNRQEEFTKPKVRKRQRGSALEASLRMLGWRMAGNYIRTFQVAPNVKFVLAVRVSTRSQKNNLRDQAILLRNAVELRGGIVVGDVRQIGIGSDIHWLRKAVRIAKENDAIILAETTGRLVRHPSFHPTHNPDQQATEYELEALKSLGDGVDLMTWLDPNATPDEVRSQESKRGQIAKSKKGGRPRSTEPGYKKRLRKEKLPDAIRMHLEGKSYGCISKYLRIPKSTIQDWIKRES